MNEQQRQFVEERFIEHVERARAALATIEQWLDDFGGADPDAVNWTHVGSMSHMADSLEELAEGLEAG